MSNLQNTLDSLQPYVIGIRYIEGICIVDASFKEGWALPQSTTVQTHKADEANNYLVFSDKKGVGLDDLLNYVDSTIKLNIEKEKKQELYKQMVEKLKAVFKNNKLSQLYNLRFTFEEEEASFDTIESEAIEEIVEITPEPSTEAPFDTTEEDLEILEEEKRAALFLKQGSSQSTAVKSLVTQQSEYGCNCSDTEACSICMDDKDL